VSQDPQDQIDKSRASNCCGAPILGEDICSECKEHCEPESIEPSERQLESQMEDHQRPLTAMENWQRNYRHNVP
jgi:hypothetical protein